MLVREADGVARRLRGGLRVNREGLATSRKGQQSRDLLCSLNRFHARVDVRDRRVFSAITG